MNRWVNILRPFAFIWVAVWLCGCGTMQQPKPPKPPPPPSAPKPEGPCECCCHAIPEWSQHNPIQSIVAAPTAAKAGVLDVPVGSQVPLMIHAVDTDQLTIHCEREGCGTNPCSGCRSEKKINLAGRLRYHWEIVSGEGELMTMPPSSHAHSPLAEGPAAIYQAPSELPAQPEVHLRLKIDDSPEYVADLDDPPTERNFHLRLVETGTLPVDGSNAFPPYPVSPPASSSCPCAPQSHWDVGQGVAESGEILRSINACAGKWIILSADATDADKLNVQCVSQKCSSPPLAFELTDGLKYTWAATDGVLLGAVEQVVFRAPDEPGKVTVTPQVADSGIQASDSETLAPITVNVIRVDLAADNVAEDEELTQGALVSLNEDNDDFKPGGPRDYDPDLTQQTVPGEDDLLPLRLDVDLGDLADGQIVLELSDGLLGSGPDETRIKVWETKQKERIWLDGANPIKRWTVEEFKRLPQPVSVFVEGVRRSESVKDAEIALYYRSSATDEESVCEDRIRFTVAQLILDVNRDGALTDEQPVYLPGRRIDANASQELTIGATDDRINPQEVHLIVVPISDRIASALKAELKDVSTYPGICMNRGFGIDDDFSFEQDTDKRMQELPVGGGDHASIPLFAKDFGGRSTAVVSIIRKGKVLATLTKLIPLDADWDGLPDRFEDQHRTNPAGGLAFDKRNNLTTQAVGGRPDGEVDTDLQPATPGASTASLNPTPLGTIGDGISAFEEYRGFETRDINNANNANPIETDDAACARQIIALSPHIKDMFVKADVYLTTVSGNLINQNLGIGRMSDWQPLGFAVHRLATNQYAVASRIVNTNRTGISGATLQRAIRLVVGSAEENLGFARVGELNTGPDGVQQSSLKGDDKQAPMTQGKYSGLAFAVCIRPGQNGILDPPFDRARDRLNAAAHQIIEGTDGRLDTVKSGYRPQEDDRVRGSIMGTDGFLRPETRRRADTQNDIIRGTISGDSMDPLDPRTVKAAPADELSNVLLDLRGAGVRAYVNPSDTRNRDGTVSPRHPVSGAQDGFQTLQQQNSFFMGAINEGANGRLDTLPQGNDVIFGTIEEGADQNLQSRPYGGDFVRGFIDGGRNGVLDPAINNAQAIIHDSGGRRAAADDLYRRSRHYVDAGWDGVCNTIPQPGSDDGARIPAGQGEPHAPCILRGPDFEMDSTPSGDDEVEIVREAGNALGFNQSPNEHNPVEINPVKHVGVMGGLDWFNPWASGPANPEGTVSYAITTAAGAIDPVWIAFLQETMGHEGSHACHVNHWFQARGLTAMIKRGWFGSPKPHLILMPGGAAGILVQAEGFGTVVDHDGNPATPPVALINNNLGAAHAGVTNMITNAPLPVPSSFDAIDLDQVRLHLKH